MTVQSQGTAVITGASSGIGAVYADRLARRGYDLVLVARNEARLRAVADRVSATTHRRVEVVTADLGKSADLLRVENLLRSDASVTFLVNKAGFGARLPTWQADVDLMEAMIDVNVTALMRLKDVNSKR